MKNFLLSLLTIGVLGFTTGCSDNENVIPDEDETGEEIKKSGMLTANETWTADNIYILDGKVIVSEGITLTIQPGTIIKGGEGLESKASALVVDQGGKLMANGTAAKPIIFTSILDNIEVGQKSGTNLDIEDTGLWGGIIVLGRAPVSLSGNVQTAQIEGIPANESYGQYGGSTPNDNSGSLKYISIRHGGITIGQDNEINGLTLGGVGSGTVIDHIEIVANQDDGIEWFGGSVNSSNLVTWAHGDDGFDADQAYSGTITNGLVIQTAESGSALELDGPEGSAATEASFTMNNITINGGGANGLIADLRDGVLVKLNNVLVYNIGAGAGVKINGADAQKELVDGRIAFSKWEIVLPTGVTLGSLLTGATVGSETRFITNATAIAAKANATIGANTSVFSWTYAAEKGAI